MLFIKSQGGRKKYRGYGGSSIFTNLSKILFSSGIKNAINDATKSEISQKIANAVVNGASFAAEKAVKEAATEAINLIKLYVCNDRTGTVRN